MTRQAKSESRGSRFFAASAMVVAALIVASFPLTYFVPITTGSRHFTLVQHLHGLALRNLPERTYGFVLPLIGNDAVDMAMTAILARGGALQGGGYVE